MRLNKDQAGFGPLVVILIVAVVALVGVAGWRLMANQDDSSNDGKQTTQQSDAIDNAEDLDAAVEDLNTEDIDAELDTSEIDAALE